MKTSGLLGFFVMATGVIMPIVMGGHSRFILIPVVLITVLVSTGLGVMTYGSDYMEIFKLIPILLINSQCKRPAFLIKLISNTIIYVYTAGLIGLFIGVIQMCVNMSNSSHIGAGIAVCLICLFYSLLLCECFLRPCKNKIEHNTTDSEMIS